MLEMQAVLRHMPRVYPKASILHLQEDSDDTQPEVSSAYGEEKTNDNQTIVVLQYDGSKQAIENGKDKERRKNNQILTELHIEDSSAKGKAEVATERSTSI